MAVFIGYNQYWPVGFMVLWFLCPGAPEDSTSSSSAFKAPQKTGRRLKSHPTGREKPGLESAIPGL